MTGQRGARAAIDPRLAAGAQAARDRQRRRVGPPRPEALVGVEQQAHVLPGLQRADEEQRPSRRLVTAPAHLVCPARRPERRRGDTVRSQGELLLDEARRVRRPGDDVIRARHVRPDPRGEIALGDIAGLARRVQEVEVEHRDHARGVVSREQQRGGRVGDVTPAGQPLERGPLAVVPRPPEQADGHAAVDDSHA
ncbi:MAG: hypothetical protein R2708_04205 [Vicinamibacterales bacterium]